MVDNFDHPMILGYRRAAARISLFVAFLIYLIVYIEYIDMSVLFTVVVTISFIFHIVYLVRILSARINVQPSTTKSSLILAISVLILIPSVYGLSLHELAAEREGKKLALLGFGAIYTPMLTVWAVSSIATGRR